MRYRGSCHCGRVAYEVDGDLDRVVECNCSICSRKGWLLWFVPIDKLRLLTPEDAASVYRFNRHVINHRFCPVCGIAPYSDGVAPNGERMAAVNVRCLDGVDPTKLSVTHYDGRSL